MDTPQKRRGDTSQSRNAAGPPGRSAIGYCILAGVSLLVVVAIVALLLKSSTTDHGDPHIALRTGSTNGLTPDNRVGIEPPVSEDGHLMPVARTAGCILRLHLDDEGHQHLPPGAPRPSYRTIPATSGPHVEDPYQQADGAYLGTPEETAVVHSLEHGRMALQYNSKLAVKSQRELLGLYGTFYGGALLYPNDRMPYEVAAVTWTNLLGCNKYQGVITLEAIRKFGEATWGKYGGEPVTGLDPSSPTPATPALPTDAE